MLLCCVQSCPTLCDAMDCSPEGFCVHGIFQARILEWVVISYSRGSSWPRDWTWVSCISCISRQVLYHCTTWEAPMLFYILKYYLFPCHYIWLHPMLFKDDRILYSVMVYLLSHVWLCDPMDCSPPGSSVCGIFLSRVLEWIVISSSWGPSWPRDWTWVSCIAGGFFTSEPLWKPSYLLLKV